jgi:hypothetical protein
MCEMLCTALTAHSDGPYYLFGLACTPTVPTFYSGKHVNVLTHLPSESARLSTEMPRHCFAIKMNCRTVRPCATVMDRWLSVHHVPQSHTMYNIIVCFRNVFSNTDFVQYPDDVHLCPSRPSCISLLLIELSRTSLCPSWQVNPLTFPWHQSVLRRERQTCALFQSHLFWHVLLIMFGVQGHGAEFVTALARRMLAVTCPFRTATKGWCLFWWREVSTYSRHLRGLVPQLSGLCLLLRLTCRNFPV